LDVYRTLMLLYLIFESGPLKTVVSYSSEYSSTH
jgi:hypothetical protein